MVNLEKKLAIGTGYAALLALAYAPWHDALFLGQRELLAIPFWSGSVVSSSGVANILLVVVLYLLFLATTLVSWKRNAPSISAILFVLFPSYLLLRSSPFDQHALTSLSNFTLSSLMIYLVFDSVRYSEIGLLLRKHGLKVLLVSYTLAIILPFLISIPDYRIFQQFGSVDRYRGFLGEGQPIGFLGATIAVWGGAEILTSRRVSALSGLAIAIGFLGIYLNILRIALIVFGTFFLFAAVREYFYGKKKWALSFVSLWILAIVVFSTGNFSVKSNQGYVYGTDGSRIANGTFVSPVKNPKESIELVSTDIRNLDRIMLTSHRTRTWYFLWDKTRSSRMLGAGTGSSSRILKVNHWAVPEPGSEYVRALIDHGVFGLIIMIIVFVGMAIRNRRNAAFFFFTSGMIFFLSDIILIIPSFGYVPIFLGALAYASKGYGGHEVIKSI